VFLLRGKGASLIAGFNTMSDEEKKKYDEKALCRAVGKLLIAIAAMLLLFPISIRLEAMWLFWLAMVLSMVLPIGFAIYANTGNRYRKPLPGLEVAGEAGESAEKTGANGDDVSFTDDVMARGKKVAIAIGVFFGVAAIVGTGALFIVGEREPNIIIHPDSIQISAMYGTQIPLSNIAEVTLDNRSMSEIGAGTRTNGYGGFATLRGHFRSAQYGSKLLFVTSTSSPTIRIDREVGTPVFISYRDESRTVYEYRIISEAFRNSQG
jgi:hypothetical protein